MIDQNRLKEIENSFSNKNIAVIGDMMLDGYFWGDVTRISPEAPVPIIEIDDEFFKFGGAANVALNILKLGGKPIPIGVIGDDADGKNFLNILSEQGISSKGIFVDNNRPTTVKTRVIGGTQHIVRIDKENKNYIDKDIELGLLNYIGEQISSFDAIILQDYNKGIFTPTLIDSVITIANKNNKIITVDPKFLNFKKFKNVTLFKPNRKESEDILGIRIETDKDIANAGKELLKILGAKYVLLTLGENGIALFEKNKSEVKIPTKARKVADVSGAGDTVISTLTISLCAGATIEEAAYIANYAGGLVCEEIGIVPIDKEKLFNTISRAYDAKFSD